MVTVTLLAVDAVSTERIPLEYSIIGAVDAVTIEFRLTIGRLTAEYSSAKAVIHTIVKKSAINFMYCNC